ncbi:hypothetical protein [Pseudanabaena sp. 'Roaring Creek']|jgi:hypothetical protein|uniref:hypothetical protein n=1 Tax=Pseudanabaena sp. 'Roaring Creek' TaxID=1681830 RepID=UPI0006D85622|nr:hypothetical protein [Pseudanabaena sp. 'Roaring Creek']
MTNSYQFGESFNLAKIEPEIQKAKKLIAFLQSKLGKSIRKKKTSIDLQIAKNHLQILLRDCEIATNVKPIIKEQSLNEKYQRQHPSNQNHAEDLQQISLGIEKDY